MAMLENRNRLQQRAEDVFPGSVKADLITKNRKRAVVQPPVFLF